MSKKQLNVRLDSAIIVNIEQDVTNMGIGKTAVVEKILRDYYGQSSIADNRIIGKVKMLKLFLKRLDVDVQLIEREVDELWHMLHTA